MSTNSLGAWVEGCWLDLAEKLSDTDLNKVKKMKTSIVELRTCHRETKMRSSENVKGKAANAYCQITKPSCK